MSADRKVVLESCGQHSCYSLTWKIHRISWFQATKEDPLKSSTFSTNEKIWQLGLYRDFKYARHFFFVDISLCSATKNFWNVLGDISIAISGRKYFPQKRSSRLVKWQKAELWEVEKQSVFDLLEKQDVKNDVLTLDINIETWQEHTTEMVNRPEVYNLNIRMAKMLTNQTLTDVTLKVKGKEFKAHKVVLAAASPVFKAMFKEGTKEHQGNYVNIQDIDSDVFEVFLRFLYTGQLDKLNAMCLDLLVTADKYDVQPLREICVYHMAKNISVDNAVDMLALADRHNVEPIKLQAQKFITNNMAGVMKTNSWASLIEIYSKVAKEISDNGPVNE